METIAEAIQPFDTFLEGLLEENKIRPEMRQEFVYLVESALLKIEKLTTEPIDTFKEILDLLEVTEKYIVPEKQQEFTRQIKLALWNSNIALVETLSKETNAYSEGSVEIDKKWHELRRRAEIWKRRFQLLRSSTLQDLEATLMWMAEQGVKEDLDLLRQVKKNRPYPSADIVQLLEITEQRLNERVYRTDKELQNFFDLSHEEFARITDTTDAVENLCSIKESLEALFKPEEVRRWLHTPRSMFAGRAPIEIIIRGELDRILEILVRLEEGIHNYSV